MLSEDEILVEAIGSLSGGLGRHGAQFAAKRLKKNVHEIELQLPSALRGAVAQVYRVLLTAGSPVAEPVDPDPDADPRTIRFLVGAGMGGLNPVLVTAVLRSTGAQTTGLLLRAAAKEGLIKQRAGEKTAVRIAALLAQ
ncbi:hypothetical protein GXW83_04310 [Streptacidiphilus sp. PB12-B1b]|uniref:hypothetical protein n=1 Tax=Streptacidiphilus sp. PB12-B1b TaxID=2705012 RepID=UPI0015FCD5BB|nr:hypothetical protein [Streptacidiphilus sp. PB12-B1b]QMU75096.1 hypothetical protein GXW83_04310 [Streptacidiphilus sp. PB12-B1b]